jgi:uncharacterized surface protein with fasciclin (FAS1) repeats
LPIAISEIGRTNDGASFLSSFYSDEEFTIYAPTDQAFEGYGLNTSNIQDENAFWLQDVFKYHVSRRMMSRRQRIEKNAGLMFTFYLIKMTTGGQRKDSSA